MRNNQQKCENKPSMELTLFPGVTKPLLNLNAKGRRRSSQGPPSSSDRVVAINVALFLRLIERSLAQGKSKKLLIQNYTIEATRSEKRRDFPVERRECFRDLTYC